MDWKKILDAKAFYVVTLCAVFLIYLLFPTTNSTIDAYGYAASIKYGRDLWEPFHLLYNVVGYGFYHLLSLFFNIDVLAMMKALNAVAATLCLHLLYKILNYLTTDKRQKLLLILFCAFSFGVWRFATENENYIFPIVFSLLGSLYYIKYLHERAQKHIALAGFFAAFACLFHVIHFFWWLGLFFGILIRDKQFKTVISYLVPSLICPVVYLIVIMHSQSCGFSVSCIWSFFGNTLSGPTVDFSIGWDNFYLGIISFFRTFYQVHGNLFLLFRKEPLLILVGIASIVTAIVAIGLFFKKKLFVRNKPTDFIVAHLFILALQLLFAFYSKGNAEFMVMLPFLLVLLSAAFIRFDYLVMCLLCASLLIWNLSLGILPSHFADFNKREKLLSLVKNNKGSIYLLEQNSEVLNQIYYQTGVEDTTAIKGIPKNAVLMKALVEEASKNGKTIITDFYGKPKVIDRGAFTQRADYKFMNDYKFEKTDSFVNFYGTNYISGILP